MSNAYWRDMVKHGLKCSDEYADILLEFESQVSNGIDTSEATWEELDAYWSYIDQAYKDKDKDSRKDTDSRTEHEIMEEIIDSILELQDVIDVNFPWRMTTDNLIAINNETIQLIIKSIKKRK